MATFHTILDEVFDNTLDENFDIACHRALERRRAGIGTLKEKSVHAALKFYLEPDAARHEQPVGDFVADIRNDSGIIEVQSQDLDRLQSKLGYYLPLYPVTVVYPVIRNRRIVVVDKLTGERLPPRLSPVHETFCTALAELYGIRDFLTHKNLTVRLLLLDAEDRRLRIRGRCVKRDTIPTRLIDSITLRCPEDYHELLPALPPQFTSRMFSAAVKLPLYESQLALNVLTAIRAVFRVGRDHSAYIYEVCPPLEEEACEEYPQPT